MAERFELEDGRVLVRVRSRRGTGTRDEDEITVRGVFEDVEEAEEQSGRLTDLARERMREARQVGVNGRLVESGGAGDDEAAGGDAATDDADDEAVDQWADADHVSKVYLGEGADVSGWVPLPEAVVREQLVPLVRRFAVESGDTESISVNFSGDVTESGWTDVDAGVVTRKMVPIVEENRLDG